MIVEFVIFNASDNVELQSWLNNENGNVAAIHIHGMSGNGYEKKLVEIVEKSI